MLASPFTILTSFSDEQKIVEQHRVHLSLFFYRYFFTKNQMFPSSQTSTAPIGLAVAPSFFSD
jgi:hypothetical protein